MRLPAVLFALALSTSASWAQTTPDPKAVAAARELVGLSDMRATLAQSIAPMLADMRSGATVERALKANPQMQSRVILAAAKNPQAWSQATRRVGALQADMLEQMLTQLQPELEQTAIEAYAQTFTAAELQQIAAFYRTPVGAKALRELPRVMGKTSNDLLTRMMPQLMAKQQALAPQIEAELGPLLKAAEPQ